MAIPFPFQRSHPKTYEPLEDSSSSQINRRGVAAIAVGILLISGGTIVLAKNANNPAISSRQAERSAKPPGEITPAARDEVQSLASSLTTALSARILSAYTQHHGSIQPLGNGRWSVSVDMPGETSGASTNVGTNSKGELDYTTATAANVYWNFDQGGVANDKSRFFRIDSITTSSGEEWRVRTEDNSPPNRASDAEVNTKHLLSHQATLPEDFQKTGTYYFDVTKMVLAEITNNNAAQPQNGVSFYMSANPQ